MGLALIAALLWAPVTAADGDAGPLALDLRGAMEMAGARNAQLAILHAQKEKAEGAEQRSMQAFLPTLSADSVYLRADTALIDEVPVPVAGMPLGLVTRDLGPADLYSTGIQIFQPLVNLDAWRARDQAVHQVESRDLAYRRGRRELEAAVVRAYFGVKTLEDRRRAIEGALQASRRALAVAEAGRDQGLVASLDVYRARSEVATRRSQAARVDGEIIEAETGLRQLLGLDAPRRLVLTDPVPDPPAEPVPAAPVVPAADRRNDVRAGQKALDAADSGVERAQAAYLPRLNLVSRYQWADGDEPFGGDLDGWLVAVYVRWVPFAGMAQAGALAEARAERREARARLQGLRQQAWQEIDSAHAQWRAAYVSWQEGRVAVEEAALALETAEQRYREGIGNMTDLLAAQAAHLQARVEQTDNRYRALVAQRQYALALGPGDPVAGGER